MSTLEQPLTTIVDENMLAAAITKQAEPSRATALNASITLGWRSLLKLKHVPSQLIDATIFPILMTLMFTYIFGGAIAGSVEAYVQQLIPGILVLTVAMSSQYSAIGLNTDIAKGIFDRFRSLSFWRPAVLIGTLLGDMIRYTVAGFVIIGLGLFLGFRPAAGMSGILLSLGIVLLFSFSLSWVWTMVGLLIEDAQTVSMVSSLVSFPLLFMSNVFVDPETMPELMQRFVYLNPVTITATAVRGLMAGTATTAQLSYTFAACALLIAIFAPITMYLFNHKNTK